MTNRSISLIAACSLSVFGCAGEDESSTSSDDAPAGDPDSTSTTTTAPDTAPPATTDTAPPATTTTTDPTTPATTVTTTTTTATTTTTPTTTTTTPTTTTTTPTTAMTTTTPTTTTTPGDDAWQPAPSEINPVDMRIPSGEFVAAPGDLIALRTDGDLVLLPNASSPGNEADPVLLLDRADPREPTVEGPGPNVVDDVEAFIDGAILYGDCCEPVSGNIYAVDAPLSSTGPIAVGRSLDRSPDGERLAIGAPRSLGVYDLSSGEGRSTFIENEPGEPFRQIDDVAWIDDDTIATLSLVGDTYLLSRHRVSDLARATEEVVIRDSGDIPSAVVRFTGRPEDGLVGVAADIGDSVVVEYFDEELEADDDLRQTFPATVSAIRTDPGGLGQTWVDGGILYHLGPGQFEARPLTDGILAAWFVQPS